jgi:hypothetical protein
VKRNYEKEVREKTLLINAMVAGPQQGKTPNTQIASFAPFHKITI